MSFFELDGHKVWYESAGDGEPIVWLHNGGNDHHIWEHQVAHFSRMNRVYVLDHLGYGRSDKPDIDYDLGLYVRQLEAFFAHERLEAATLVGHCIGGGMALAFTLRHPDKVRSLVLFNVATEKAARAGVLRPLIAAMEGRPKVHRFVSKLTRSLGSPRWLTKLLLRLQLGRRKRPEPGFCDYQHGLYNRADQFRAFYSLCVDPQSWGALDAVTKPAAFPGTLLFWGNDNKILPAAAGRKFRDQLCPDESEFVDGTGHLMMCECPDLVNGRIERFLASQAAVPRVGKVGT